MKVAIQGIKGSFHHKVAQDFFSEDVEVIDCNSFQALVNSLVKGEATDAVMAIENSIAGSIIPNYALLDHHNLNIEGERYLAISQNLMVMPGQKLEDIHEVWSHPMALWQCKEFFKDKEHIRLVEDDDTAGLIFSETFGSEALTGNSRTELKEGGESVKRYVSLTILIL